MADQIGGNGNGKKWTEQELMEENRKILSEVSNDIKERIKIEGHLTDLHLLVFFHINYPVRSISGKMLHLMIESEIGSLVRGIITEPKAREVWEKRFELLEDKE